MKTTPLTRGTIIGYGLPGLVTAIPIIPIAIVLPSYYAVELGVGLTVTGIALGVARLFDFFSDLIVGLIIDRYQWRRFAEPLRFKPWLALGALAAAIAMYMLAHPNQVVTSLYLGIWSSVLFMGWTLMMVPYTAWGAVLSNDPHARSQLTIAREVAGLIGMLIALSAPLLISENANPLNVMFWLSLILGLPALSYTLIKVPEQYATGSEDGIPQSASPAVKTSDVLDLLRFRPFRSTLGCWFLNSLANGLPAVLFPIVVQQYLKFDERELFILLFVYFGSGICASPIWLYLAKRAGKVPAWRVAIGFNILAFLFVLTIDPTTSGIFSPSLFYLICALTGVTLSADLALPPSIQADVMAQDRAENNRHRIATAFALWSMTSKLALGLAVMVGFVSLGMNVDELSEMTGREERYLLLLYVCLPCFLKANVLYWLGQTRLAHNAVTLKRR